MDDQAKSLVLRRLLDQTGQVGVPRQIHLMCIRRARLGPGSGPSGGLLERGRQTVQQHLGAGPSGLSAAIRLKQRNRLAELRQELDAAEDSAAEAREAVLALADPVLKDLL